MFGSMCGPATSLRLINVGIVNGIVYLWQKDKTGQLLKGGNELRSRVWVPMVPVVRV